MRWLIVVRSTRRFGVAVASLLVIIAASARDRGFTRSEIEQVKRIGVSLIGTQYLSEPWRRLEPYFRDEHAIGREMVCTASYGGGIELRGGYSIRVSRGDKIIFHREAEPKLPPFHPHGEIFEQT